MQTLRNAKIKYHHGMEAEGDDGYYQRLEFTAEQLPEIGLWEPGGEYYLIIKVREKSHSIDKIEDNMKEMATFEVLEVAAKKEEYNASENDVKEKLKIK